jgi:hypothetical protein
MPDRRYPLSEGDRKRLRIRWTGAFSARARDVRVWLDDEPIAELLELKETAIVALRDGASIELRWVRRMDGCELHVSRAGVPLPGSAGDPQARLDRLAAVLYVVGGATVLVSAISEVSHIEMLAVHGYGFASGVEGSIVAALGWFVGRGSRLALGLAVTLVALELILSFASGSPPLASIAVHVALLGTLPRGFSAIAEIEARAASPQLTA